MALQIRRGAQADLPASPANGELLYATDSGNLYIGVGGSPTLISFGSGGGGNSNVSAISDLTDVGSISGIVNGQALLWNTANSQFEFGNIPASYGNADVQAYLDDNSYANTTFVTNTVNTANSAMQVYVDAAITNLVDGAPAALDTLAEIANALNNSNSTLSAVAFSGDYDDLTNTPTLTLTANTYLTLDGANIDLSSVVGQTGATGPTGPQGNVGATGNDGVSVSSATISTNELILTLSNSATINAGNVRGPVGPQGEQGIQGNIGLTGAQGPQGNVGPQGDGNAGVSSATVTAGNLIITLNDSTTINAGDVTGPQGNAGVGITSTSLVGGNLILNYSNTSTQDVGNIQGIQGAQGNAGTNGTSVSTATVNGSGNLILTLSNASTIDAGNVRGADGAVDQTLSIAGNVITISGSGSNVDLTNVLGSFHTTNTDAQTLNLAGNTLTISGSNSTVDLSSFAGGGGTNYSDSNVASYLSANGFSNVDSDAQTLSLDNASNVLTISGSNSTVDFTRVLSNVSGGGGGSQNVFSNVAVSGQNTLVADSTTDTLTFAAGSGISITTNSGTDTVTIAATGGGGGGSGATIERFKVNYDTSGAIDSISNISSGISNVAITNASDGDVQITFNSSSYNLPPGAISSYGYDYVNNKYYYNPLVLSEVGLKEIPGGGSSGSPTLFDGASSVVLSLNVDKAATDSSSRAFPASTTHAWLTFVMYD